MKYLTSILIAFVLLLGCTGQDDDYTKKMEKEHANDEPVASPISEGENTVELETKDIVYAKIGDKEVKGYLAQPKGKKGLPGVIVIQEWWGLNDNIKAMARKIAGEGYVALAVDLYNGSVATTREEASALMKEAMTNEADALANLEQAYKYLTEKCSAPKIGSIGWCFGGHWSIRTGLLFPKDLDAVAIYYGKLVTDKDKLSALSMPILGIFGALDKGIPVNTVKEFETALKELGKNAQIHVYPEANHAFANPSGTLYHEKSAKDAWSKTIEFFAKNLK